MTLTSAAFATPPRTTRGRLLATRVALVDVLPDLDALPAEPLRCGPLGVTIRRPVPHLALRFDFLEPRAIRVASVEGTCAFVGPRNEEVARRFVLDPRDRAAYPEVSAEDGLTEAAANDSWTVFTRRR